MLDETLAHIDLRSKGFRQLAYEAGNIAAIDYRLEPLPEEALLRADLAKMLTLYQMAVAGKRELHQVEPGSVASPGALRLTRGKDPLTWFKPKDDSDYLAHLSGKALVKTRRHEALVRDYAGWASSLGYNATNPHPIDLMLESETERWVVGSQSAVPWQRHRGGSRETRTAPDLSLLSFSSSICVASRSFQRTRRPSVCQVPRFYRYCKCLEGSRAVGRVTDRRRGTVGRGAVTDDDIGALSISARAFVEQRGWQHLHTPKNLLLALMGEVGELVEHFTWLTPEEVEALVNDPAAAADPSLRKSQTCLYTFCGSLT